MLQNDIISCKLAVKISKETHKCNNNKCHNKQLVLLLIQMVLGSSLGPHASYTDYAFSQLPLAPSREVPLHYFRLSC